MNSKTDFAIPVARTKAELRQHIAEYRKNGKTVGFVPTMGALHSGHISLVEIAQQRADCCVASIFVNPTQFAPGEDFDAYPRDSTVDIQKLADAGCRLVYMPDAKEMYPDGTRTDVRVEGLSDLLDGIYRPHFFYGVSTVVARLFLHVQPDVAVFGEKDYQQLQIIRRMVHDLGFPIEIIGGETRRDPDGLAQSSRNAYLTQEERENAGALQAALHRGATRLSIGALPSEVIAEATALLDSAGFRDINYVSLVAPNTLENLPDAPLTSGQVARLLGAAWMGKTRLIDNVSVVREAR